MSGLDVDSAIMCLNAIKETGDANGVVDFLKSFEEEGGADEAAKAWFAEHHKKEVRVNCTGELGIVARLNKATRGFYPGNRYPIYVRINGGLLPYHQNDLTLLENL